MGYDSLYFADEVHSSVHLVITISCGLFFSHEENSSLLCYMLLHCPPQLFPMVGALSACHCHDIRRIYIPLICLRGASPS